MIPGALHRGFAFALALVLSPACARQGPELGAARDGAGGAIEAPPAPVTRRTTSGAIALTNLDASIAATEAVLARGQSPERVSRDLIDLYGARTRYLGSYGDFSRMGELATFLVGEHPSAASFVARASFFATVHEFESARRDLEQARALGADVDAALHGIAVATGADLAAALAYQRERAEASPTFHTLSALATTEGSLGLFAEADAHYVAAAHAYRDVSPLPLAWIAFARGVLWAESANRADFALPLYQEAVTRIPDYAVANVHLAELEAQGGDVEGAIARLTRVARLTEDPEPKALLAELLLPSDPAASAEYGAAARDGYEALLARYPLAFADHAAEFLSGPIGADPNRALALAVDNLIARRTPRAYLVAIEAARSAAQDDVVCELSRAALPLTAYSANLKELVESTGATLCR